MEQEASGILSSWLAQLGVFGLGLVVIGLFVWLWMRESRAVRADTETIIARKDKEIADLKKELSESEAKERDSYNKLLACLYPKNGGTE
ncbi:LapA family protein [Arthrobacter sp. HS15c]|uniref:LapA family protein n=1 Tax=Arthrobacter sp. HS15c TaxID=3230279 RepID=UPI0034670958